MKRANTVQERHSLLYALGVKRFANLDTALYEVAEVVLRHAFETKDEAFAMLFSSLDVTVRRLFWQLVSANVKLLNFLPPATDVATLAPPMFDSLPRSQLCWCFDACHVCGKKYFGSTLQKRPMPILREGGHRTILVCALCLQKLHCDRAASLAITLSCQSIALVGCKLFDDVDGHASFERACKGILCMQAVLRRICIQKWKVRSKVVCVKEVVLTLRIRSKFLAWHLCITESNYKALRRAVASNDKIELFRTLFVNVLALIERRKLIGTLCVAMQTDTAECTEHTGGRRKKATPTRIPPLVCTHSFGDRFFGSAKLICCSSCK